MARPYWRRTARASFPLARPGRTKQVFFTSDNFESSLPPLTIPSSMLAGLPEVTSAHFAGSLLLFVVNQKVYTYDYKADVWNMSQDKVSVCSAGQVEACNPLPSGVLDDKPKMSNSVFAYLYGDPIPQASIYVSDNGGCSFEKFTFQRQVCAVRPSGGITDTGSYWAAEGGGSLEPEAELAGALGGIFFLHALSQVGLLAVDNRKGMFAYSDHPLNRSLGLAFDYNETLEVLIPPDQRGFLILWSQHCLLVSPNSGQVVDTIHVEGGSHSITIHTLVACEYPTSPELFRNAQTHQVRPGPKTSSASVQPFGEDSRPKLVSSPPVSSLEAALMFLSRHTLQVLIPLPDSAFPTYDFKKCTVNIQAAIMDPKLHVKKCRIELIKGNFGGQMYTIDMNSELQVMATLIFQPGTSPIPLVIVSNPYSLGQRATISVQENTYDRSIRYKLDIKLKQQHHWGRTDPNFTSSIKRTTISTLMVDVVNKEISCVDMRPQTALISVGCDLEKRIFVQEKSSACSKGILNPLVLENNYTYVVEREAYDPTFHGQKATEDLVVAYQYKDLGCPHLVYYGTPWKPIVELWRGNDFQEVVQAEYVLREVHGLFTYSYLLTAGAAHCASQPQNWSTMTQTSGTQDHFPWNRENYVSCHNPSQDNPLRWPDVQYEILGGPTANRIVFKQRNGIYIFRLTIVDPYYSYCPLETTFSIYVHGAFPLFSLLPKLTIFLLVTSTLVAMWLAYTIPKLLRAREGLRIRGAG
ncbi:cation channel sperm-associated auxiliary subunit delta [Ctenodactylus gundi]